MSITAVILAAGQGKRMHSDLPKVLHPLGGKPLLQHIIDTLRSLSITINIVYGHQGNVLKEHIKDEELQWVLQDKQLGTGHAVQQALPHLKKNDQVLILCGDVPLIKYETLKRLIENTPKDTIGIITVDLPAPFGYGRIKRDANQKIIGIVEEKDADDLEKQINEINTGIYFIPTYYLEHWLPNLKPNNAQGEYYLTDIIAQAIRENVPIHTTKPSEIEEVLGVNDRAQLAYLERYYQKQQAAQLLLQGVTLLDPNRLDIRGNVIIGRDVIIDVNVILEGEIKIGNHCYIGPNVYLKDVELADHVEVKANSIIESSEIGARNSIGPFARIRPGTITAEEVHIGNFVEVKNSQLGAKTKANHLTYLGDSYIGENVNIGAGTITCNYDGANKHRTIIEDDVHIGSDTQLVAPVKVAKGVTVAAGSTITKDVNEEGLVLTQILNQRTIKEWKRPVKKK